MFRTYNKVVTLPLYVLVQQSEDSSVPWDWFVTAERIPDGAKPYMSDCLASGFALTRRTARWGAKRACRRFGPGGRKIERWIYDPIALNDDSDRRVS